MNNLYFAAAICTLLFFSCSKENHSEEIVPSQKEIALTPGYATKCVISDDGSGILWLRGDRLSVFDGKSNCLFKTLESGRSSVFYGLVDGGAKELTIVYPYSEMAKLNANGEITACLPVTQWACCNSVSNGANISVGKTPPMSGHVSLLNVGGYIRIKITKSFGGISRIDFISRAGETIGGQITIGFDEGGVPYTSKTGGSSTVSLCPSSDAIDEGTYYLVANPVVLDKGFDLVFHRTDGKYAVLSQKNSYEIRRNKVLDLGTIPTDLEWSDGSIGDGTFDVELNFDEWPFDMRPGNKYIMDKNLDFVASNGGYRICSKGSVRYEDAGWFLSTADEVEPYLELPSVYGYKLVAVRQKSRNPSPSVFFTDASGNDLSMKELGISVTDKKYRIEGAATSSPVRLCYYDETSFNNLILTYAGNSHRVLSVCSISKGKASFTYQGGQPEDYSYGFLCLPSGELSWDKAVDINGSMVSSTSSSIEFQGQIPEGTSISRAYARPAAGSLLNNQYGAPQRKTITLSLDFSTGTCPLAQWGDEKKGDGSFLSPREGYSFPDAAQSVINQTTGETSNGGESYYGKKSGVTKWWTNFPSTAFAYKYEGCNYQFILGTVQSTFDASLYYSAKNKYLYTYKLKATYPMIPGHRMASIEYYASLASGKTTSHGMEDDYKNLGETNVGAGSTYSTMVQCFPRLLPESVRVSAKNDNVLKIKKITVEYEAY